MRWLVVSIEICWVIEWMIFILWVMMMIVIFSFVLICLSRDRILVVVFGFSVEVDLLVNKIDGLVVSVWVILICCFCLFESWFGWF